LMPRSDMTKPRSMPLGTSKTHFLGFSITQCCHSFTKTSVRSGAKSPVLFDLTTMSSTLRFYDVSYRLLEDTSHASLESSARILEPEGHRLVVVRTERSDE
jgi:hypothetical protein